MDHDEEVSSLPWHHDPNREGCSETMQQIDEGDNLDQLIAGEDQHGANLFAGLANWAIDRLDYVPERMKVEIPEDAQETANELAGLIGHDEGQGTAEALFGLAADAHEAARYEYIEQHGEDNVEALDSVIRQVRNSYNRHLENNDQ